MEDRDSAAKPRATLRPSWTDAEMDSRYRLMIPDLCGSPPYDPVFLKEGVRVCQLAVSMHQWAHSNVWPWRSWAWHGSASRQLHLSVEIWVRCGQAELMVMDMVEKSDEEMQYLNQKTRSWSRSGVPRCSSRLQLFISNVDIPTVPNWPAEAHVQVARRYNQVPTVLGESRTEVREGGNSPQEPALQPHRGPGHLLSWMGQGEESRFGNFGWVQLLRSWLWNQGRNGWNGDWPVRVSVGKALWLSKGASNGCLWTSSRRICGMGITSWHQARAHPTAPHHRLGILERNHAVRRKMLEVSKNEMPDCPFDKALQVTNRQRNRLSSVKGSTPATLAFGYVPSAKMLMTPGPKVLEIKLICLESWRSSRKLPSPSTMPIKIWHFVLLLWLSLESRRTSSWWVTTSSTGSLRPTSLTPSDGEGPFRWRGPWDQTLHGVWLDGHERWGG